MPISLNRPPLSISVLLLFVSMGAPGCSPGAAPEAAPAHELSHAVRPRLPERRGPRMLPFDIDVDGVRTPQAVDAHVAPVPDDSLVIGVRLGSAVRAYLLRAFEMHGLGLVLLPDGAANPSPEQAARLSRHVVNDVLGDTAVTITYCDLQQCARVLTQPGESAALDVGVGGWDDGLLLIVNGERVPQRSDALPLQDMPFEVTTWKDWRERFPETDIYVGG